MTVLCHALVIDRVVITADCYVREDVARQSYVYLSKHEFFFQPFTGKQVTPTY